MSNFCNKDVTIEAWYAVCKSKEVKNGKSLGIWCGNQNLLIKRFKNGKIVAYERYCHHMGADLLFANEVNNTIQCNFHGLCYDTDGKCKQMCNTTSLYNLKTFSVSEKYGLVFVYLGGTPKYLLPELKLDKGPILHFPSQKLTCHHHILIPNPLDSVHIMPVHSLETHNLVIEHDDVYIKAKCDGKYRSWWMAFLSRTYSKDIHFEFSSYGSSISVADAKWHGTRVVILFTAYQNENNKCITHTAVYLDSYNPFDWIRSLIVIIGILRQDVKILNSINVNTNFSKADKGMTLFKEVVDSMPIYIS